MKQLARRALALVAAYFDAGFLLFVFLEPEDGADMFFRNVG
jgi:hypothetical protein